MSDMEFYASTVDEAVEKAASKLGLSASDLEYEVLDEGSPGFLGIGARDARIRVRAPEHESFSASDSDTGTPPEPVDEEGLEEPAVLEQANGGVPDTPADEELLGEIEGFTQRVVEAMGFDARIDVYETQEYIAVDVSTDNTALFIGQKGETIDALQFLINSIIYKNRPFHKRIVLDSEGYRQRRVEAIQGMAHRTARRAVRERRRVEMPPMSASERRIVHIYLRDNPRVTTSSEGKGNGRRVIVYPNR